MNRGDGTTGGADDGADFDLEVIDLEPTDAAKPRHDPATGVGRRRGPVVIAIVVVVALVGSAIVSRSHRSLGPTSTDAAKRTSTIGLDGTPLFPFRVGAQILTGGLTGMLLVDTDTGRVTTPRITGLPQGPVTIVAHSGGTIAVRADSHLYWFSMPSGVAHRLDADTAFASAQGGHLWLASQRFATEVPGATVPAATNGPAIGATRAGLLVVTKAGVLLQPTAGNGTGAARLLLPAPATVIGVHPDRVAWVSNDCGVLRCPVHVTEVATGATSSWLQLAGHPSPLVLAGSSARFSPDGVYSRSSCPTPASRSPRPSSSPTSGRARPPACTSAGVSTNPRGREAWTRPATPSTGRSTAGSCSSHRHPGRATGARRPGAVARHRGEPDHWASSRRPRRSASRAPDRSIPAGHGSPGPIDTGGPTRSTGPGSASSAPTTSRSTCSISAPTGEPTLPVGGPVPNPARPNSIARVTGGWLVVRGDTVRAVVDLRRERRRTAA